MAGTGSDEGVYRNTRMAENSKINGGEEKGGAECWLLVVVVGVGA